MTDVRASIGEVPTFCVGHNYKSPVHKHRVCEVLGNADRLLLAKPHEAHTRRHWHGGVTATQQTGTQCQNTFLFIDILVLSSD